MGLVHEIFTQEMLDALRGLDRDRPRALLRRRATELENAQPIVFKLRDEDAALARNGDIVNYERVRRRLQLQGVEFLGSADTETMAQSDRARVRRIPGTSMRRSAARAQN